MNTQFPTLQKTATKTFKRACYANFEIEQFSVTVLTETRAEEASLFALQILEKRPVTQK